MGLIASKAAAGAARALKQRLAGACVLLHKESREPGPPHWAKLRSQPPLSTLTWAKYFGSRRGSKAPLQSIFPQPSPSDLKALSSVGLRKSGRHWTRDDLPVAVEFPGSGDDIERTVVVKVVGVSILMISCEDLYLARIRQATVSWPREDVSFDAALELALTNYTTMDWDYIRDRLKTAISSERIVGTLMAGVNRRVRSRVRRGSLGGGVQQSH
jgi:hypothetical protein